MNFVRRNERESENENSEIIVSFKYFDTYISTS